MLQMLVVSFFPLRQTGSRQAGENSLYTCVGTEEFTESPGSSNNGGISTQVDFSCKHSFRQVSLAKEIRDLSVPG